MLSPHKKANRNTSLKLNSSGLDLDFRFQTSESGSGAECSVDSEFGVKNCSYAVQQLSNDNHEVPESAVRCVRRAKQQSGSAQGSPLPVRSPSRALTRPATSAASKFGENKVDYAGGLKFGTAREAARNESTSRSYVLGLANALHLGPAAMHLLQLLNISMYM